MDHCVTDVVGCHVAKKGDRWAALELVRQGVRAHMGGFGKATAAGLGLRNESPSRVPGRDADQLAGQLVAQRRGRARAVARRECQLELGDGWLTGEVAPVQALQIWELLVREPTATGGSCQAVVGARRSPGSCGSLGGARASVGGARAGGSGTWVDLLGYSLFSRC